MANFEAMANNGPSPSFEGNSGLPQPSSSLRPDRTDYQVVARRYRPQLFEELVGQEHVARALKNAVTTGRVGHAYLFAGARGVGKTSAARILAKALNCEKGPTPEPCNRCSICQDIAAGSDIDVLEVDGASNRGIEEVRALRQNATLRPSRARYKIYIIDEVHMLTREAFNALLKTLEEPPPHVKFIFCTTEPNKVPATILSRCQRFDFSGISPEAICRRLSQILEKEGITAEPEALAIIARRAGGSMRDAQSLLEQVLAFGEGSVTEQTVRQLLGLAADEAIHRIVGAIAAGQPAAVLQELDQALTQGMDLAVFMEQLAGYFRDLMIVAAGCTEELLLYTSKAQLPELRKLAEQFGLETILAALQLLDHTLNRMRFSFQPRLVAELGLIRLARLEKLIEVAALLSQIHNRKAPVAPQTTATPRAVGSSRGNTTNHTEVSFSPSHLPAAPQAEPDSQLARDLTGGKVEGASEAESADEEQEPTLSTKEVITALKQALIQARDTVAGRSQTSSQSTDPLVQNKSGGQLSAHSEGSAIPFGPPSASKATKISSDTPPSHSSEVTPASEGSSLSFASTEASLPDPAGLWRETLERVGGYVGAMASHFSGVAWKSPTCLEVTFPPTAIASRMACEKQVQKFEQVLSQLVGRKVQIRTAVSETVRGPVDTPQTLSPVKTPPREGAASNWRFHPLVQKAAQLFDAVPLNPEFPKKDASFDVQE